MILEHRPTVHPESAGLGTARGVEMLLQRRAGRATGWISYTFSKATRELHGHTVPFDYDQPHAARAAGVYQLSRRFRVSGTWQRASGFPVTPLHQEVQFIRDLRNGTLAPIARPVRSADGAFILRPHFEMRRLSLRNSERLSGYSRTDVRVTFATLGHWEFYGEVINLFKERNYIEELDFGRNPSASGGGINPVRAIYTEFGRIPTFGIRATF